MTISLSKSVVNCSERRPQRVCSPRSKCRDPRYLLDVLHGRETERAQLAALVDAARSGTAGSVVVHGEPGVGKSALLAEVTSTVADVRVLRTQGLESESPLAFAALHRLLRPVLGLLERLPEPQ